MDIVSSVLKYLISRFIFYLDRVEPVQINQVKTKDKFYKHC